MEPAEQALLARGVNGPGNSGVLPRRLHADRQPWNGCRRPDRVMKNCEGTLSSSNQGILWVSPGDPWSCWTLSGVSRAICLELKRRGLLYGAIHPGALTRRHLVGQRKSHSVETRLFNKMGWMRHRRHLWRRETDGIIGAVLKRLPSGSAVIYALLSPEIDPKLPIRRFRWMDLSVLDGVRTSSFGHAGITDAQIDAKCADQRRMLEACEGVIALSTHAADAIAEDLGYPRDRITPIGAGPAVKVSGPTDTGLDRYAAGRILFVGRDWQRKGGDDLLAAFRIVRRSIPHATLTIVGPDTSPTQDDGIDFIGMLDKNKRADRCKLETLFRTSSLFCMPSICEPWGMVYVEAAQAGMPVVGFRDWALPDIVEDGETGRLTADHSPAGLAEAMIELLDDPQRASEMGRAAHKRVHDVLDWPHVVDRLLHRVMPEALDGKVPVALRPDSSPANEHAKEDGFRSDAG